MRRRSQRLVSSSHKAGQGALCANPARAFASSTRPLHRKCPMARTGLSKARGGSIVPTGQCIPLREGDL